VREKKRVLGREIGDIFVLLVLHRRGLFERSEEEIQSTRSLLLLLLLFFFAISSLFELRERETNDDDDDDDEYERPIPKRLRWWSPRSAKFCAFIRQKNATKARIERIRIVLCLT